MIKHINCTESFDLCNKNFRHIFKKFYTDIGLITKNQK